MNGPSNIELVQLVLLGVGVLCIAIALITYLITNKAGYKTFDLGVNAKRASSLSRHILEAVTPSRPISQPYLRVQETIKVVRAGDLKKTAKMHLGQALRSSQRLLSAVRREIIPDAPPSQESNLGKA